MNSGLSSGAPGPEPSNRTTSGAWLLKLKKNFRRLGETCGAAKPKWKTDHGPVMRGAVFFCVARVMVLDGCDTQGKLAVCPPALICFPSMESTASTGPA